MRLTANAVVATVLGSVQASSDTVESEGRQMKQCWISYIKRKRKKSPFKNNYQLGKKILYVHHKLENMYLPFNASLLQPSSSLYGCLSGEEWSPRSARFAKLHVANFIKIAKYKVIRCLKLLLLVFPAKNHSQEKR